MQGKGDELMILDTTLSQVEDCLGECLGFPHVLQNRTDRKSIQVLMKLIISIHIL